MVEWMLTSGGIVAFAITAMEIFGNTGAKSVRYVQNSGTTWQTMTDADLDALLAEFSGPSDEDRRPDLRLVA